jgi:hypothetical protein
LFIRSSLARRDELRLEMNAKTNADSMAAWNSSFEGKRGEKSEGESRAGLLVPILPKSTFICPSNSPQKRHPERSALRIYRVLQRLLARSRRTSGSLSCPCCLELLNIEARTGELATIAKREKRDSLSGFSSLISMYLLRSSLSPRKPRDAGVRTGSFTVYKEPY